MADVVLDNLLPDPEALTSPPRQQWCVGMDWSLDPVETVVDEALSESAVRVQESLQACRDVNRKAELLLRKLDTEATSEQQ
jgi:hypothetical protein